MQKLKIFVDCHVFDGNFQGTTTYLKGLYTELIKDENVQFYLAAKNIVFLETVFGKHNNVTYISYQSNNKFFRLLYDIPRIIKQNKIDYAHFQYVVPPIKNCKFIVTIHDVLFLDFPQYFPLSYQIKNKFLFEKSAQNSEIVLTVSEYSKNQIQKHFNIKNVTVTPNAVDPVFFESFDKTAIKEKIKNNYGIGNYFLFVSRWEPRKNHFRLLKAFVEDKHYHNYNLVFIGDKAIEDKAYNDYYHSLSVEIKNTIIKLRKVSFEELVMLVRGADLSIYPSIAEGFGIPPLESLAANVPTICSNTTAMSDFLFLEDCLFNPLDLADIKNKISLALIDTKTAQKREKMMSEFNWEKAAEQYKKAIS